MNKLLKVTIIYIFIIMFIGCDNKLLSTKHENDESGIITEIEESIDVNNSEEEGEDMNDLSEVSEIELEENELISMNSEDVKIPILMYHSISDENPENSLMVPPDMFEEQMAWLSENEFTAMNLDEAIEAMETGQVPINPVVITFDDGYMDNYISAFPVLKNYNLKATFFVITDGVDNGYYMSSDMLKEMQAEGMSIENHTADHLELNNLSRDEAYESIKRGQDYLRNTIGSKGDYLCYPVGRYSDETIEICEELGIKAAVTTNGGISSIDNGKFELKRLRIYPMSMESFSDIILSEW